MRLHRGILMQTMHTLVVECLPMDTPEKIDVDFSYLEDRRPVAFVSQQAGGWLGHWSPDRPPKS